MTGNILVVVNAEAPSAAIHVLAASRTMPRKNAEGEDLPPNPILECRSIDTSHSSLLYAVVRTASGAVSGAWIPYNHIIAIIEEDIPVTATFTGFIPNEGHG